MSDDAALRAEVVRHAQLLRREGLVSGTSGNVSARDPAGTACLITPSGLDYDSMGPDDIVKVDLSGTAINGRLKPSSDTPNHVVVYRGRPDVGAVVHTHSVYATVFAVLRREIPPLLLEAAGFLGGAVQVLADLPVDRSESAERLAAALGQARAILLSNHGVVAVGEDLPRALAAALEVEQAARVAYLASVLGHPQPLAAEEVARMHRFIHQEYGQRR